MYYHIRITPKSNGWYDELKLDLSEEKLRSQFLTKYENNEKIVVNGKTIRLEDIERIHINRTKDHSSKIVPIIRARRRAENFVDPLPDEWYVTEEGEDVTDDFIQGEPGYKKKKSDEKIIESKPLSNQIFVVHGHDEGMKQEVARTLEKLDLKPIILHEQPNQGRTIIEKFESCSENISFAIVLISPDDLVYKKDKSPESAMYRARQNVILELGYFMGKLGRKNVIALHRSETNFEFPSDILGVLYIPFDSHNGWELALAKEMKVADYDIDFGKL
jgi:predicted nucleotide-binding protein